MGRFKGISQTRWISIMPQGYWAENHKIGVVPERRKLLKTNAAHWDAKSWVSKEFKNKMDAKLEAFRDGAEIFNTKMDLYQDQVFCLPAWRSDNAKRGNGCWFCLCRHSKVGEKCCGVRINVNAISNWVGEWWSNRNYHRHQCATPAGMGKFCKNWAGAFRHQKIGAGRAHGRI